ncbi:MAG: acetyl-CoA carboxylase biotin carboxyl carrier protein [Deltaproteobacteria bacterium]|nr:acetyl-CoA carboxylase biotin carboxyl carrier protein [Deltaproteobacteria bacterium]
MDIDSVKALLELVEGTDISELEYEDEGLRIAVRRGAPPAAAAYVAPMAMPQPGAAPAAAGAPAPAAHGGKTINSPFIGTFYRSPAPDAAPFTDVGQRVTTGQTLCIVEAMKLMNEIEAEVSGTVRQILVENGQVVEFSQALFVIDPD